MSNASPPPPYHPYATQPSAPTLPPVGDLETPYSYQQGAANLGFQYSASQPQPPYHVPGSESVAVYPGPLAPSYNTATGAYPGQVGVYPGLAGAYPGQVGAYPGQVGSYPGQVGPYPGQAGVMDNINSGGVPDVELNAWRASSFSDKKIRQGFIRKVYLILMVQLSFTFGIICLFMFYRPIKQWLQTGSNQAVYWVSYGVFLVTYIILVCCPSVRRKVPGNYICLAIFTMALTYMTATLSSFHNTYIVMVAIGITAAVCLAISIFAIQTRIDFTLCSGLLFVLCVVVMFFGLAVLITYLVTGNSFAAYVMNCVYGGLAALLFGLFLAYDTQLVIGGRKYQLSPEEYISGALQLYLDVVYLFIIILGLFGGKR